MSSAASHSSLILRRQLTELTKHPVEGFSAGVCFALQPRMPRDGSPHDLRVPSKPGLVEDSNLYEWEVMIIGPPDTLYEGGFFKARLSFPEDFPLSPPKMRFITQMWHPNIYADGLVCISILHPPGDDQFGYEDSGERWLPIHTVESIVRPILCL
ncbi:hypothetical protein NLI96_g4261 [Meripilus lineatus]|uniref:UBC core domain-containing protein n=1 Tax=Meripilus lineatus TaxID=2056292 RepID=A0AAD5V6V9_9APHY|nr:hypothetical protein NLI96_g4261 [Physisporinus lineatus]